MASTDAHPLPLKNTAFRYYFWVQNLDGTLNVGAVVSTKKTYGDGAAATTTTNSPTQIGSTARWFIDLTAAEMNFDDVGLEIVWTVSTILPTLCDLQPQEADDIRVAVTHWVATQVATPDTAGYPKITAKAGTGAGELDITSGVVKANMVQILASAITGTAALIVAAFTQFFNISSPTSTMNTITTVTNLTNTPTVGDFNATQKTSLNAATPASVVGAVGSVTGSVGGNVNGSVANVLAIAANAVNASALATDAVTELQTGLATSAAQATAQTSLNTIAAYVDTEVASILTAVNALPNAATIKAQLVAALITDTYTEPTVTPAATSSLKDKINFLFMTARNQFWQTGTKGSLYADDGTTVIAHSDDSDDGTTFKRGKFTDGA